MNKVIINTIEVCVLDSTVKYLPNLVILKNPLQYWDVFYIRNVLRAGVGRNRKRNFMNMYHNEGATLAHLVFYAYPQQKPWFAESDRLLLSL